jgi:hypothetical protein
LFLQTDPIPGGSANNYDYCTQDPINCYDLNGEWGVHWKTIGKSIVHAVQKAAPYIGAAGFIVCVAASAGACAVATAIGVAASAVGRIGGCAASHCTAGQWAGAVAHTAFDAALTKVAGPGVRSDMEFMNQSMTFSEALSNGSRNAAIGTGVARGTRQALAWGTGSLWR